MNKTEMYIVKTEQPKLLKALQKQGIVSDVIALQGATGKKRGRKPGRVGRPPKA